MKRLEARVMPAKLQEAQWTLPKDSILGRYDDIGSTGFIIVAVVEDDQTDRLVREFAEKGVSDFILITPIDGMYKKTEPASEQDSGSSGK